MVEIFLSGVIASSISQLQKPTTWNIHGYKQKKAQLKLALSNQRTSILPKVACKFNVIPNQNLKILYRLHKMILKCIYGEEKDTEWLK